MTKGIKIALYIVLSFTAVLFGYTAFQTYNQLMNDTLEAAQSDPAESPETPPAPSSETNASAKTEADTKASTDTHAAPATSETSPPPPPQPETERSAPPVGYSRVLVFGGCFFIAVLGLGLLVGHDISHFVATRFYKAGYDEERAFETDPDYEHAEQQWADGRHLDAIRLMREYLQRNPREQHVALRIAEIYEKDLHNNLAAALEYEEVLKHKLPPERWGWAAIHLCNLYFKLNHPDKAVALLRRIDAEYPNTAAAEKARKRLALYDAGSSPDAVEEPS